VVQDWAKPHSLSMDLLSNLHSLSMDLLSNLHSLSMDLLSNLHSTLHSTLRHRLPVMVLPQDHRVQLV